MSIGARPCTVGPVGTAWLLACLCLQPAASSRAAAAEPAPALTVRLAPERDCGPFVFVGDNGQLQGLSVGLLQRLGRADLVSWLRPTPERAAFLAFTRPYVQVPAIVVQAARPPRGPGDGRARLEALAGRPVAVGAG